MTYVEVLRGGVVLLRKRVDSDQARGEGYVIRIVPDLPIQLRAGESARLGEYHVRLHEESGNRASPGRLDICRPDMEGKCEIHLPDTDVTLGSEPVACDTHGSVASQDGVAPDADVDRWLRQIPEPPSAFGPEQGCVDGAEIVDPATVVQPASIPGYKLLSELGAGGMGTVWRAMQLGTGRVVALKMLQHSARWPARAKARFRREVRLSARLHHPHIARVYDSGLHCGMYYYAMELIEGVHLDERVRKHKCSRRNMIELVVAICRAVQYAHEHGVIHRDLKPANILVSEDGTPHLVDFGLAKDLVGAELSGPISRHGDIAGSIPYMSPEQAAGSLNRLDARSDVYSLGVILYELIMGRHPHNLSGRALDVIRRIATLPPVRPRSISARFDVSLEATMLNALAPSPSFRYSSVKQFADDLEDFLQGRRITPKTMDLIRQDVGRGQGWKCLVGLVLIGLLAGGSLWAYRTLSGSSQPSSGEPCAPGSRPTSSVPASAPPPPTAISLPACVNLDIGASRAMKLVPIPAGRMVMGTTESDEMGESDERPVRDIRIDKPFYMSATEVTQEQWKAVMNSAPWAGQAEVIENSHCPATYVSWHDAVWSQNSTGPVSLAFQADSERD